MDYETFLINLKNTVKKLSDKNVDEYHIYFMDNDCTIVKGNIFYHIDLLELCDEYEVSIKKWYEDNLKNEKIIERSYVLSCLTYLIELLFENDFVRKINKPVLHLVEEKDSREKEIEEEKKERCESCFESTDEYRYCYEGIFLCGKCVIKLKYEEKTMLEAKSATKTTSTKQESSIIKKEEINNKECINCQGTFKSDNLKQHCCKNCFTWYFKECHYCKKELDYDNYYIYYDILDKEHYTICCSKDCCDKNMSSQKDESKVTTPSTKGRCDHCHKDMLMSDHSYYQGSSIYCSFQCLNTCDFCHVNLKSGNNFTCKSCNNIKKNICFSCKQRKRAPGRNLCKRCIIFYSSPN